MGEIFCVFISRIVAIGFLHPAPVFQRPGLFVSITHSMYPWELSVFHLNVIDAHKYACLDFAESPAEILLVRSLAEE
jgi:hypothetical protein